MKKHIVKFLTLSLVLTSAITLSPTTNRVDVVSAASEESSTTTAPAPATTPTKTSSTTATTTSSTYLNISRMLRYGSQGNDVKSLQTSLNKYGYKLDVDGFFGPKTLNAVKSFQNWKGLVVDGIVGPKTLAKLTAGITKTSTTTPTTSNPAASAKVYQGLGHTAVFRNGPGKDANGVPVYSFSIVMADVTFDAQGRILSAYLDGYEVATPNYDGASMPHFSGWPGTQGYNVTDHNTGKVTGVSSNTLDSATAEVSSWQTKRQRGDSYGMNPANEWYKQMNFYQKFFVGKTVDQLEAWFAKNTTSAGRPIKANTTNPDDLAKLAKLTSQEKAQLADVVAGATMSLRDPHGDFLGALRDAYNNRVEATLPAK